ncbi:MAG TPA: PEGA domain-containing protein [Terriglobales bacterium]|jgi:serine/threonine-protein kinase|nr:PEGA domain-containing protein [Terriglobales bacterium]
MANQLGRFEILGEITRSPMACVLKAQDPESNQTVALKTFDLQALGEESAEALRVVLAEAESIESLNSHNLVLPYGVGDIDGQFCGSMEYVQGDSIANMLARGDEFSIWDLQDVVRQVCQGLDHAHAHKVVHYTLEPAKVMVQWDGTVKILGLGISTLSLHTAKADPASTILSYMSPEQVRGDEIDGRSNIFSLGAMLYEMVTRHKPFDGCDSGEIKANILHADPVPPNEINPKLHALVNDVILKALAKDPEVRYQSGQELVNALERKKDEVKPPAKAVTAAVTKKTEVARAAPEMISALDCVAPASVKPKARAAAAGVSSATTSLDDYVTPANDTAAAKVLSAAAPGRAKSPKIAVDPAMAAPAPGKATRSFSEMDELPPMKEAPTPQFAPAAEVAEPAQELRQTKFQPQTRDENPKPVVEVAKKAVEEIRKTPPKLFLYAIGAAVLIMLIVIGMIASHIHRENADEDGSVAPAASRQTSHPAQSASSQIVAVPSESVDRQQAVITIKSKPAAKKVVKAAAPVVAVVPGEVTVNTVPAGAQISVDGQVQSGGVTPYDVTGLSPGHHVFTVTKAGFITETRNLEVASRSKFSLFVQLTQTPATVLVTAEPAGAQILLDGHDTGKVTPSQISVEKPGAHTLLIKKQGYLDESTTVNLEPGQSFRFAPSLKQLGSTDEIKTTGKLKKLFGGAPDGMAAVSVKTQPKGAQIAVNRHLLDKSSPAEFYLNPGTYVIDITMTGYKSVQRVVTIDKSAKLAIDEVLERQ